MLDCDRADEVAEGADAVSHIFSIVCIVWRFKRCCSEYIVVCKPSIRYPQPNSCVTSGGQLTDYEWQG